MTVLREASAERHHSRGQSVVEFALVIPILLLLLAAAADFGRIFYAYVAVENAAKEGAFYGARSPLCDDSTNPVCGDPNNVAWHVANEAPNLVDSGGNSLLTSVVACRNPAGVVVQPINNCADGDTYQVTVTYPFRLITPILSTIVGQNITLSAESQATVISSAFDPTGIEALVWVDKTGGDNATTISAACIPADTLTSPNFYYQPCQDAVNQDRYLQFQEKGNVNYKVRVRNTGNIDLTGLSYAFSVNATPVTKPGNCSTLPAALAKGAAPVYCTFSRTATSTDPSNPLDDDSVFLTVHGQAGGLATGDTASGATIKVVPAPHLAINLLADRYRLGGSGNGVGGNPDYSTGNLALSRNTSSTLTELQNPTAWFSLTVQNQGGVANNFTVSVTQQGSGISLPGSCTVPTSLAASGQPGDTFTCVFPRTLNATQAYAFVATATATNAVMVPGQQPAVTVTTATCNGGKPVYPNLVDTLTPSADGTNKTVGQAKTAWQPAPPGPFTGAVTVTPAGATNASTTITQSRVAYTCGANGDGVTIGAQ